MALTVTVFSGHRVDDPDRDPPRFPAAWVPDAERWIDRQMERGPCYSGAANGGDIMFLEAALARGLETHAFLPLPVEAHVRTSVASAAPGDWESRFRRIWAALPKACRHEARGSGDGDPFAQANGRILEAAAGRAQTLGAPLRMLAIWDGAPGDGPGGTADMVARARARHITVTCESPAGIAAGRG